MREKSLAKWGHFLSRKVMKIIEKFFLQNFRDNFAVIGDFLGIFRGTGEGATSDLPMTDLEIGRREKIDFLRKVLEIFSWDFLQLT